MSGHIRLALCATAATLLASCALLPLVDSVSWLLQAALLLALQSGAGALARRVPLARPLTVLAQAVVTLLLLTVVFASGQALAGFLPGPDAFARFAALLEAGAQDVGQYAIPAPLSDGIRLMLVGGVLVIGLAVDALAVTFRSAAPAGLPLLALYSVAAGLSDGGAGWVWFVLAAAGYLLLLLAEGRDRLSRWGRVFSGGARRPGGLSSGLAPGGTGAVAPVRTGRRIGVVALGIALAVPAALPSLDGGLLDPTGGGGGAGSGGGTISAVNPLVSLQNSLNQPNDREVISYRTNSEQTQDMYLRIVALDQFDGTAWKPAERAITDVPGRLPVPGGLSPEVRTTEVQTNISAADWYKQNWLPMPFPATQVSIDGRWRYEPVGRTLVGDRGQHTGGRQYEVKSLELRPTAKQLAEAPAPNATLAREFTSVPDSLPADVYATARRVTRGSANDYERAVKLQDWFTSEGGFTYDTEVQAGSGAAAISRFLKQKEGFCVHFAFSMAAMSRTLGIPARVAVGFTPGAPQSDGTMSVGLRDAHAWPELYFEGVGWTRFEPTPTRGSTPEYTRQDVPAPSASDSAAPEPSASAVPSDEPSPSATESCPRDRQRLGECGAAQAQGGTRGGADGPSIRTVVVVAVGVLLVVGLPLLPLLWRTRARARRLGGGAAGAGAGAGAGASGRSAADVSARTLAVWREVIDLAWDYGILPDDSLTPRKAAERIVRVGHLTEEPAQAAHRLAAAVEQVLYAPHPRPAAGLAEDVRLLRAGLRTGLSRASRMRAVLAPRSAVRVAWAFSARRRALTRRLLLNARGESRLDRWSATLHRPGRPGRPGRQQS
ncbi:transglutaminaseTgpA domain-containing protein [Streptomyces sp. Da 82-17]|uniref:transglutaminase family protein n=1 Tax=Streptomyces sp. Da 82-17 TaxID=3377116 RepID=UPI0038D46236